MNQLIVIGGPTASGKTALSLQLAEQHQTVILSADSRQFYREMNIGTAKPTAEELKRVPHHFINSLSIFEPYSVGNYERDALALLDRLFQEHERVLLVGGSGLFIRAVCEGLDEFPEVPESVRDALDQLYETAGLEALQEELAAKDPVYFKQVDRQNPMRLIRALSVCRASGQPYSSFRKQQAPDRPFEVSYHKLEPEREELYQRINLRVDQMITDGLVEEAKNLYPHRHLNALQTVGYQELFDHFAGKISLEEAIELIKRNTRRYAKRQLTWFRRQGDWKVWAS